MEYSREKRLLEIEQHEKQQRSLWVAAVIFSLVTLTALTLLHVEFVDRPWKNIGQDFQDNPFWWAVDLVGHGFGGFLLGGLFLLLSFVFVFAIEQVEKLKEQVNTDAIIGALTAWFPTFFALVGVLTHLKILV